MKSTRFAPEGLQPVPGDKILAVNTAYKADTRPHKLNAAVGIYYGPDGKEYIFPSVEEARKELGFGPVNYLNASGEPVFIEETAKLLFGDEAACIREKRLATLGTIGGTNALVMMAKLLAKIEPGTPVLIGKPAWANHEPIFSDQKIPILNYSHLKGHEYNFEAHLEAVREAPPRTLVLFQTGLTHNPVGTNPESAEQWQLLAEACRGKRAFFDTPYAGFGEDLITDIEAIRIFLEAGISLAVAMSYSKNASMYKDRVGALLIVTETPKEAKLLQGHLNQRARVVYSTPPAFGERVIAQLLRNPDRKQQWQGELRVIAQDLRRRRKMLAQTLGEEFDFVENQHGLFSLLFDTSTPQAAEKTAAIVRRLAEEKAIYMTEDGRMNIGGIPVHEIERFGREIRAVL